MFLHFKQILHTSLSSLLLFLSFHRPGTYRLPGQVANRKLTPSVVHCISFTSGGDALRWRRHSRGGRVCFFSTTAAPPDDPSILRLVVAVSERGGAQKENKQQGWSRDVQLISSIDLRGKLTETG